MLSSHSQRVVHWKFIRLVLSFISLMDIHHKILSDEFLLLIFWSIARGSWYAEYVDLSEKTLRGNDSDRKMQNSLPDVLDNFIICISWESLIGEITHALYQENAAFLCYDFFYVPQKKIWRVKYQSWKIHMWTHETCLNGISLNTLKKEANRLISDVQWKTMLHMLIQAIRGWNVSMIHNVLWTKLFNFVTFDFLKAILSTSVVIYLWIFHVILFARWCWLVGDHNLMSVRE